MERKREVFSRGWFRSIDLWVMGPARSHCATLLSTLRWFPLFLHCARVAQATVAEKGHSKLPISRFPFLNWSFPNSHFYNCHFKSADYLKITHLHEVKPLLLYMYNTVAAGVVLVLVSSHSSSVLKLHSLDSFLFASPILYFIL